MERKFLKDLGLEDEAITKIMAENGKDIQREQEGVEKLKHQVADYEKQIGDRDKQLKDIQDKVKGNEDLEGTIKALQETNKKEKEALEAKLAQRDRDDAISEAIREYKPKNLKAILANLDNDIIKIEDGSVTGLKEQLDALKKSDAYLFNESQVKFNGVKPGEAGDETKTEAVSAEDYYTDKFKK